MSVMLLDPPHLGPSEVPMATACYFPLLVSLDLDSERRRLWVAVRPESCDTQGAKVGAAPLGPTRTRSTRVHVGEGRGWGVNQWNVDPWLGLPYHQPSLGRVLRVAMRCGRIFLPITGRPSPTGPCTLGLLSAPREKLISSTQSEFNKGF